jgi:hypothetical protein
MKLEETKNASQPPRRGTFKVEDDELYPLTRAYPLGLEQPPPLPGRSGVMARVEATFVVREDELVPLTHAEWVHAPRPSARSRKARRAKQHAAA